MPLLSRVAGALRRVLPAAALAVASLFLLDALLILLDVLPPRRVFGDPELGFREPEGTGVVRTWQSPHWRFHHSDSGRIVLNERGFRTSRSVAEILRDTTRCRVAVIGDSQTDLPYRNDLTHPFIVQTGLRAGGLSGVEVLSAGRGRYSPLQAYLYFCAVVRDCRPQVLVLNLYTGNDLFDLVREDDRPVLQKDGDGYRVAPPVWYQYDDPALRDSWTGQSRVLFAASRLLRWTGLSPYAARVRFLYPLARTQGGGAVEILGYLRDLSGTVEQGIPFPRAYGSQVLNQYLFFRSFPVARAESLSRLGWLLRRIRSENPSLRTVLSPIPSAALAGAIAGDPLYARRLAAARCDAPAVAQEEGLLYAAAVDSARAAGWDIIDNREVFSRLARVPDLYMWEDLHLSPLACRFLAENEVCGLLPLLASGVFCHPGGS